MTLKITRSAAFQKDFNKLVKRFKTLSEDLKIVQKNAIELYHHFHIDNKSVFFIHDAGNSDKAELYKVKKMACKSLKGRGVRSGLRLIYVYLPLKNQIILLELYYKGDKENHDPIRIKSILKDIEDY